MDSGLKTKKSKTIKAHPPQRDLTIIERLPNREYLIANDLYKLGLTHDPYIILKWLEWGITPEFTAVRPIMALYKTKDVVELLAYIELQKKIDQQVVDKKIEDQI